MEKRRHPRFDHAFETRYWTLKDTSQTTYTVSKNISKSGLLMPASVNLAVGDMLKLEIGLKGGVPSVSAIGKVVRIKNMPRPAILGTEVGIEIVEADAQAMEKLIGRKG